MDIQSAMRGAGRRAKRHIRMAIVAATLMGVTGCFPVAQRQGAVSPRSGDVGTAAFEEAGPDVARHLTSRYAESFPNCDRNPNAPAFVCSGIMLRGVHASTAYHAWDVNPTSKKYPGVSFSYLRHDAPLLRLAYGYSAGFIFYPKKYANGNGLRSVDVLCAFPIDGNTDIRADKGCGVGDNFQASGPCQAQGITTAEGWLQHFQITAAGVYGHQCAFLVARGQANSAAIFMQVIAALGKLNLVEHDKKPDELVLDGWAPGNDETLPIEALFYLSTSSSGLAEARSIQEDYKKTASRRVPIIQLTLPATQTDTAKFSYNSGDQAVPGG